MLRIVRTIKGGTCSFFSLVSEEATREEIITFFLAMLELLRLGRVKVRQERMHGDILLSRAAR
ncbi:MAG: hypothetical protein GX650_03310 [Clostridiales bacterium]|nr:hypothetical protein [Clostridiales bacterium]